jgi:hypothetical protein
MILLRAAFILSLVFLLGEGKTLTIQKISDTAASPKILTEPKVQRKIAILSSPKVIGRYSQTLYNVSLATLMSLKESDFVIKRYDAADESTASLHAVVKNIHNDGMDAILAPLTFVGAENLIAIETQLPIFIPTVHKRDLPSAGENFTFGGIDYVAQIEALLPYMGDTISIFYDTSSVGMQLRSSTEEVFLARKSEKKKVFSYAIDTKGDNIVTHLAKPSKFNKTTVILHVPVVKSALLSAHMTFTGVKERNILSTQINIDPTLLTLTQYNDRKNMILANSLIEFPAKIYESNALMNHDISMDWIQYATSVGIDYLIATLDNTPREYTMRLINGQVIYPVELVRAKEFGFEPLTSR